MIFLAKARVVVREPELFLSPLFARPYWGGVASDKGLTTFIESLCRRYLFAFFVLQSWKFSEKVLQPPTPFHEYIWVKKKKITK